ncbi:HNH endonuclease [Curtobacterium albidum]|uniref:HNH endonuclease n=1 Tax=Curtobacterium citreum TaxID=2036 RepID=A0A850DTE0_9MICO|nr:HNH endonuclease signature motif containing protein [Curtobacterium albidum]NUU27929.1 HNH endonuclease [Curtobacterium albidum]
MQSTQKLPTQFLAKVASVETDGCWLWTASVNNEGYGKFTQHGVKHYAHRFSYAALVGPIPEGMFVDHICFQRNCVNPAHLRLVTPKQNSEHREKAQANSKSGVRGVTWHKKRAKWRVSAGSGGVHFHGGYFDSLEEAAAASTALRQTVFTHDDHREAS